MSEPCGVRRWDPREEAKKEIPCWKKAIFSREKKMEKKASKAVELLRQNRTEFSAVFCDTNNPSKK